MFGSSRYRYGRSPTGKKARTATKFLHSFREKTENTNGFLKSTDRGRGHASRTWTHQLIVSFRLSLFELLNLSCQLVIPCSHGMVRSRHDEDRFAEGTLHVIRERKQS